MCSQMYSNVTQWQGRSVAQCSPFTLVKGYWVTDDYGYTPVGGAMHASNKNVYTPTPVYFIYRCLFMGIGAIQSPQLEITKTVAPAQFSPKQGNPLKNYER